jgi:hypothetical protein
MTTAHKSVTVEQIAVTNTATDALLRSDQQRSTLYVTTQASTSKSLVIGSQTGTLHVRIPPAVLTGEDYPVLVRIWDNDADAIYDNL